jgi:hypothetical protein
MTLTQEQRIAVIKHAAESLQKVSATKSVADFIEEIKSEEVLGEHGLLDAQEYDVKDEASLFDYSPNAESIDEEDLDIGVSDEMKGVYND